MKPCDSYIVMLNRRSRKSVKVKNLEKGKMKGMNSSRDSLSGSLSLHWVYLGTFVVVVILLGGGNRDKNISNES